MYALVYLDDILVTSYSSKLVHDLIHKLYAKFALNKLGNPVYLLVIEVTYHANDSLLLTQSKYVKDLLEGANMPEAKGVASWVKMVMTIFTILFCTC